jgi:Ni/Fe-hydrogenase subunit HybB-like protein
MIVACGTLLVAWSLWQCQAPGWLEDSQRAFPGVYWKTTTHGWPAYWLLRVEHGDVFGTMSREVKYSILPGPMALDLTFWCIVIAGTACVLWRLVHSRAQVTLRTLLWATAAVAVLFSWWRLEYHETYAPGHPEITEVLRALATTPMLRLLQFPAHVCILVLLGMGFGVLLVGFTLMRLFGLVKARLRAVDWMTAKRAQE